MVARLSILSLFAILLGVATSEQCYGVDGTVLDDTYTPCNPSAKHSGCCSTKDTCLSNGLCMATTGASIGQLFQSGCTDKTGKDTACPQMCPGVSTGIDLVATWQLQTCDHGKYCCRAINDTNSCCNNSTAPKVTTTFTATLQLQTSTATATSEPIDVAATAVSTGTPFEATATPLVNTCQKEKRQTAIVGGTIGSLFGAIIIALAATIFWMYSREKRQRKLKEHYEEQFQQTNAYRKALASSAGSVRGSVLMEEFKTKSSDSD